MTKKVPTNEKIYADVVAEFKATTGQTFEEVSNSIQSEYERRCKAYLGDDVSIYEGDGKTTPEQDKKREEFKKRMQSQGRLPKGK